MIAELKFITAGPTRYDRGVATSLRAAVNKREQQLYQEYLTQLRLKDRKFFHTPAGTVGPLIEIRFIKFNLTSRAYQTKLSPLEGLARPRALPRPPPRAGIQEGPHH